MPGYTINYSCLVNVFNIVENESGLSFWAFKQDEAFLDVNSDGLGLTNAYVPLLNMCVLLGH